MIKYDELIAAIESFAPLDEYVDIDSSGIQVKTGADAFDRILVCLEINDDVIDEAIQEKANMIVTHHPLIFYPMSNVTSDTVNHKNIVISAEHTFVLRVVQCLVGN